MGKWCAPNGLGVGDMIANGASCNKTMTIHGGDAFSMLCDEGRKWLLITSESIPCWPLHQPLSASCEGGSLFGVGQFYDNVGSGLANDAARLLGTYAPIYQCAPPSPYWAT